MGDNDDEVIRLQDHRRDPQAGVVEFELTAWVQRRPDGRVTTHIEYDGVKEQREAARHLQLIAANMEGRDAEAVFWLAVGRDPNPLDPAFPWRWGSDWYSLVGEGTDPELCGEDDTTRMAVLEHVVRTLRGEEP